MPARRRPAPRRAAARPSGGPRASFVVYDAGSGEVLAVHHLAVSGGGKARAMTTLEGRVRRQAAAALPRPVRSRVLRVRAQEIGDLAALRVDVGRGRLVRADESGGSDGPSALAPA